MEEFISFELDLGSGTTRLAGQALEDVLYNCLDFCLTQKKKPHFYLAGADAIHHPELWSVLELLREQAATFSILSGPEQSEFEMGRAMRPPVKKNTVQIRASREACCCGVSLGSLSEERLADLWDLYQWNLNGGGSVQ